MRHLTVTLMIAFFCFGIANAQTIIPDSTEVYGTWTKAGSPYLIEGEITVPNGDTLIIESGVRIEMMGWYKFNIEGHFEALGQAGDTIVFTTNNPDSTWHGLRFDWPDDTVKLQYVKIENGHAELIGAGWTYNENGGGIYGSRGNYIIENSVIQNNQAESAGGGCYFQYAYVKIINSAIIDNSSKYGGGISMQDPGSRLIMINSIVSGNACTQNGGGINCNYTPFSIYNCEISGNTARWGGGIYTGYVRSDIFLVSNSIISQNTAERGSGFYGYSNDANGIFSQCSFTGNVATENNFFGTTITKYSSNYDSYFTNCMIVENQNYICLSTSYENIIFENSILRDNGDILDVNQLESFDFKYSNTNTDFEGTGNINEDPQFIDPDNGDYRLSALSPCLDTGNPRHLLNDEDGTRNDMGVLGGSGLVSLPANDTINYGPAAAGDVYYLAIVNTRNDPVSLQSIVFSDPANFSCSRSFPITINALDSVRIPIEYLANTIGDFQEQLTITSTDFYGTSEITFQLTGYSGTFGELTGTLSESNSPYLVTGDITVPADDSLNIEPGVELQFAGKFQINVFGQLKALGTESDSIVFNTVHPDSLWGGILFIESRRDNQLKYVSLSRATESRSLGNYYDEYGAISCRKSRLLVDHGRFTNNLNHNCAGIAGIESRFVIKNTLFENNNADYDGMIFIKNGEVLINNITCRANEGGTLTAEGSAFVIINSLIAEQSETSWGHFNINNSYGMVSNCILYNNLEWRPLFRLYQANLEILNSVIWENGENLFDIGYQSQINVNYSDIQGGYAGTGNIDADPNFEDAAGGNFQLAGGSPCIDRGFPSSLYDDMDGSRNDMGLNGGNGMNASPPLVDFGNTGKGQEKEISLKIHNLRETPVNLSSITITDLENFNLQNAGGEILKSYSTDTILVTVLPVETGQIHEYIVLGSDDLINGDTAMIPVSVNAGYWQGEVSGVWTKENSPYIFGGDITVPEGKSLTIEPGVLVQIDTNHAGSNAEFRVIGSIRAHGKETDSIIFSTLQDGIGLWKGLVLEDTASFAYCIIENAMNGIEIRTRDISILNCHIRNSSRNGVYWNGGDLSVGGKIINSVISNNQEYGMYCYAGCYEYGASANPLIKDNIIQHNQLGGIYVLADGYVPSGWTAASRSASSSPVLMNNLIVDNNGPGIMVKAFGDFAEGTPVDLRRYGNARPELTNNIISGNLMAIDAYESSLNANIDVMMINNTLWDNGSIAVNIDRGTIDISNSIIWGNQTESIQGANEAEITVGYSNLKTLTAGENIISMDPLFVSTDSNDFRITCLSPCVNAGNPSADTTGFYHDFYGNLRIYAGIIDIGAAENKELPHVVEQPSDLESCLGGKAELRIIAEGEGLEYKWYQPGTSSSISDDSSLVFDPAEESHSGNYFCTVSNHCNIILISDTAALTVYPFPSPIASFDFTIEGRQISLNNFSEYATVYFWEFGDGDTSSAENPKHTYENHDEYTLVLTASSICGDDQDSTSVMIATSLTDWYQTEEFMIYPNPASDIVYLKFRDAEKRINTIQILDLKGNTVKISKSVETGDVLTLRLGGLATGVYFIKVIMDDETYIGRIKLE